MRSGIAPGLSQMILRGAFLGFAFWLGLFSSSQLRKIQQSDAVSWIPETPMLRVFKFGFGGMLSACAWVVVIQEFAESVFFGGDSRDLYSLVNAVTKLDPSWEYPYEFSALGLPDRSRAQRDSIQKILQDGILEHPLSWRLKVYSAMIYAKDGKTDSAEIVLRPLVAGKGDVPKYVRTLGFSLILNAGDTLQSVDAMIKVLPMVRDPIVVATIKEKVIVAYSGKTSFNDEMLGQYLDVVFPLLMGSDTLEMRKGREMLSDLVRH